MTAPSYDWRDAIRLTMEIASAIRDTIDWMDKRRRAAIRKAEEWQEEYSEEIEASEPPVALP